MLPRLLGFHRAMEIVLLNPRIDAHRAVELGLANTVFPTNRFDEEVMSVAARLAEGPPKAWGVAKGLIGQAAGMERLDAHLDREIDHLSRIADGAEFAEGLDSFFEKRAPCFAQPRPEAGPNDAALASRSRMTDAPRDEAEAR
jgi:2-(1,2-epoxy-1,2-dihydrophenyl)acetyl-CoA isomerase